jgi:hypothetical protein
MRRSLTILTAALAFVLVLQTTGEARPTALPAGKRIAVGQGARMSRASAGVRRSFARMGKRIRAPLSRSAAGVRRSLARVGQRIWRTRRNLDLNVKHDNSPRYTSEAIDVHMRTPQGLRSVPHYRLQGESREDFQRRVEGQVRQDVRRFADQDPRYGRAEVIGYDWKGTHVRY